MPTYQGNEPYIFISYAHKDSDRVLPIIEGLQARGFRVWFDAGINASDEWSEILAWPEILADRITGCHYMLPMLSEAAVNSDCCRKEITLALNVGKPFLPVCLEEIVLPSKLQLQLCNVQCMFAYRYPDTAAFLDALCRLEVLAPCRSAVSL